MKLVDDDDDNDDLSFFIRYPVDNIRQHLCLSGGKTGDYQYCSVLYCVLKLCTVIKHT